MGKKLVVSFPGGRTGAETPILYFCVKCFENRGYEKICISYPATEEKSAEVIYEHVKTIFKSFDIAEYETIVFVGKSIGTRIACRLREECQIPASLVLLTPLNETLPYIRRDNQVLFVAVAENDRHMDADVVRELCAKERIPCYVELNVGHRMEVPGNIDRDVEIIRNVIRKLEENI